MDDFFRRLEGRSPGYIERYRQYAILIPFLPESQELVLQVRAKSLKRQPGEISFPGGFVEEGETPLQAAVRETGEELLIPTTSLGVAAPLDVLITADFSMIHGYLAYLRDYEGTFNPQEVDCIFTVPFRFFLENEPAVHLNRIAVSPQDPDAVNRLLGADGYPWGQGKYPVLYYRYGDKLIWGITAKFIRNLVGLYRGDIQ